MATKRSKQIQAFAITRLREASQQFIAMKKAAIEAAANGPVELRYEACSSEWFIRECVKNRELMTNLWFAVDYQFEADHPLA